MQAYDQARGAEAGKLTGGMTGAEVAAQVAAQRTVARRSLDNGMVKFEVVLPSDKAAIVWAALNAAVDTAKAEPTPAEPTPTEHLPAHLPTVKARMSADRGRRRADAFMNMIQERVRGHRPQRTPIEIIITVPHASLHGSAEPLERALISHGDVIAAVTARRLCWDASVVVAQVDSQGALLSVSRKTRAIPIAIKRALLLRDRTCRFPGCTHSRYVDGHHLEHWASGGETALSNFML